MIWKQIPLVKTEWNLSRRTTEECPRIPTQPSRKSLFLFTAQENQRSKSGPDFQRVQIWNYRSQKPKTNYGSHPILPPHVPPKSSFSARHPSLVSRWGSTTVRIPISCFTTTQAHPLDTTCTIILDTGDGKKSASSANKSCSYQYGCELRASIASLMLIINVRTSHHDSGLLIRSSL